MRDRLPLLRRARASGFWRREPSTTDGRDAASSASSRSAPVLAVMPWNFPFWQVFRFAAPALMAGNVGLLKHASNVPQCALALEDLFRARGRAGGRVPDAAHRLRARWRALIDDDARRGRDAHRQRGRRASDRAPRPASTSRRRVLELGGSDPFIVHAERRSRRGGRDRGEGAHRSTTASPASPPSASSSHDADRTTSSRRASSRRWRALRVGDPMDARRERRPAGHARDPRRARRPGRALGRGGRAAADRRQARSSGPGYFYAPTVLADVPPRRAGVREELFGPVAALFRVRDVDEAIALANDTPFGLGASVVDARPRARPSGSSRELEAGMVFINGMVASDPRFPFGGVKRSGYGRELGRLRHPRVREREDGPHDRPFRLIRSPDRRLNLACCVFQAIESGAAPGRARPAISVTTTVMTPPDDHRRHGAEQLAPRRPTRRRRSRSTSR